MDPIRISHIYLSAVEEEVDVGGTYPDGFVQTTSDDIHFVELKTGDGGSMSGQCPVSLPCSHYHISTTLTTIGWTHCPTFSQRHPLIHSPERTPRTALHQRNPDTFPTTHQHKEEWVQRIDY
jgi:hypothetical protein